MSSHGHDAPDESGTNRAWLSSLLILGLVVLAAGAGLLNAAPHSRVTRAAGPTGVVVVDDAPGTVLRGTVLVRGGTIAVIRGKAGETVVPRDRVRYFRTESPELGPEDEAQFPARLFKTSDPHAKRGPAAGERCVVLNTGTVLVGTVARTKGGLKVTQADGVTTEVPSSAIRWTGAGSKPSQSYWAEFADDEIDARFKRNVSVSAGPSRDVRKASNEAYSDASKRNPKVGMAILAQQGSDWGPATGLWLQVYRAEGFKRTYFENVNTCSRNWVALHLDPFRREALEKCFDTLFEITKTHGVYERPEVQALLAQRVTEAAESTYLANFPKTSHELLGRMAALGGHYDTEANRVWQRLTAKDRK